MDMIPCLTYIYIQNGLSWNIILMGSTILLQLLVSWFLTVVFHLHPLSQKKIYTTVALASMNKNERLQINIDINWFFHKRDY